MFQLAKVDDLDVGKLKTVLEKIKWCSSLGSC